MTSTQFHAMLTLMKSHGGSFVSAIAEALRFADPSNREKLLTTFPDLVEKYGPTSKFTRTLQEVIWSWQSYSLKILQLKTIMSTLQHLSKTCSSWLQHIVTHLKNGCQLFVQHLLNWLTTNQFLLQKMVSAAILIGLIPSGNLLTPLTIN